MNIEHLGHTRLRNPLSGDEYRTRGFVIDDRPVMRVAVRGSVTLHSVTHILAASSGKQMIQTKAQSHVTGVANVDTTRQLYVMGMLVVPAVSGRVPPIGVPVPRVDVGEFDQASTVGDWNQAVDQVTTIHTDVHDLSIREIAA